MRTSGDLDSSSSSFETLTNSFCFSILQLPHLPNEGHFQVTGSSTMQGLPYYLAASTLVSIYFHLASSLQDIYPQFYLFSHCLSVYRVISHQIRSALLYFHYWDHIGGRELTVPTYFILCISHVSLKESPLSLKLSSCLGVSFLQLCSFLYHIISVSIMAQEFYMLDSIQSSPRPTICSPVENSARAPLLLLICKS